MIMHLLATFIWIIVIREWTSGDIKIATPGRAAMRMVLRYFSCTNYSRLGFMMKGQECDNVVLISTEGQNIEIFIPNLIPNVI